MSGAGSLLSAERKAGGWVVPAATGDPCDPTPLRKAPVSRQGGSGPWPLTPPTPQARIPSASTRQLPPAPRAGGLGLGSAAATSKGPSAARVSAEAAFLSPVTDGGSTWGFLSVLFPLAAITSQFNI